MLLLPSGKVAAIADDGREADYRGFFPPARRTDEESFLAGWMEKTVCLKSMEKTVCLKSKGQHPPHDPAFQYRA